MTTTLEALKLVMSRSLEFRAEATTEAVDAYYQGEVQGVLDVALAILDKSDYDEIWEHYRREQVRFS